MTKHGYDIPKPKKLSDKDSVIKPSFGQWSGTLKKGEHKEGKKK